MSTITLILWALLSAGSNYFLTLVFFPGTFAITQRLLTVTATGVDKVYDGIPQTATVTSSDNRVNQRICDHLTTAYSSAAFVS